MSHVKYFQVTMIVRNAYDSSRSPHIINQFLALENEEDLETTLYMILGGHYDLLNYLVEPVPSRDVYISPDYCKKRLKD